MAIVRRLHARDFDWGNHRTARKDVDKRSAAIKRRRLPFQLFDEFSTVWARSPLATDRYRLIHDQSFCDTKPREIGSMRREGVNPFHGSLYDDAIRAIVAKSYAEDLKFYVALFS